MTKILNEKVQVEKLVILIIFLFVGGLQLLSSLFDSGEAELIKILRAAGLCFNFIMSYYAYRNYKLAIWVISIVMLYTGVGTSIGSIRFFLKGGEQYISHSFALVFGTYFIYGGIKLIIILKRGKHAGQKVSGLNTRKGVRT